MTLSYQATVDLAADINQSRPRASALPAEPVLATAGMAPGKEVLYLTAGGVLVEKITGTGGTVTWNNYLFVAGKMVGMRVERGDGTVQTRYFHRDHLGSVAILTDEVGAVVERLSYDAWGKRRQPNGQDDPAGSLTSQTTRGFTGHEQLDDVGLVHMNGRVYDPLLGRFGTPDPMTENPFSTQGWNRYSYVGNSPLNFADPSGYCFMGCFWKPIFRGLKNLLNKFPILSSIIQIAAVALICVGAGPLSAGIVASISSAVTTGISSGKLGLALRAGLIAAASAAAFYEVGQLTDHNPVFGTGVHAANIAGHAAVGCVMATASGGKCGPGALSAGVGAAASPLVGSVFEHPKTDAGDFIGGTAASAVVGGVASVAGGGKFAAGAATAAFGYMFNTAAGGLAGAQRGATIAAALFAETGPLDILIAGVGALVGGIIGDWVTGPDVLLSEGNSDDAPIKGVDSHGEQRRNEAKTDSHRDVGDPNRVAQQGRHFIDEDTGHNVYVDGDKVAIIDQDGIQRSQFKNTRANTQQRIRDGKWTPQ